VLQYAMLQQIYQHRDLINRNYQNLFHYEKKISDLSISTKAMLEYVISFSELARHTAAYFEHGLDVYKRDIVMQVFTELYIENGELKYVATEAYQALLMRFDASNTLSCGAGGIRTLEGNYPLHL
jgi:hypothetical protein